MNTTATTMSATRMLAIKTLDFIKECIINGDCSDEELQENMSRINIKHRESFGNDDNYVNVDKAMKIVGISNRTKFFKTMREYGLVNRTINNQHIGYIRSEVEDLAAELKDR